MLSKYSAELRSRRATQEVILDSLMCYGLEKTIATLRDELGRRQTTDRMLLSPRQVE